MLNNEFEMNRLNEQETPNHTNSLPFGEGNSDPSQNDFGRQAEQTPVNEYRAPYMPNWTYGGAQPPQKPKKPKKPHKALKFAAGFLAVVMVSFGSGYLGSTLGGGAASSGNSAMTEKTVSAPVINTSSSSQTGEESVVEKVAAATANSVVEITTEGVQTDEFYRQQIVSGAGSGVVISADGYIVTNNHVIENANKITVTMRDGTQYDATLVGTDKKTDIAVIKVKASGLQTAVFGDSSTLKIGEDAIAIGNPLGQLGGTVTNGIISALDREITIDGQAMTLLQTNAAINPGNSGGGLFNEKGELVGIVNAKSGGTNVEGLGFAIPVNTAKPVIDDLIQYGYVQGRIALGFSTVDINDAITAMYYQVSSTGVYISEVEQGSNAESAGFRSGDRIVSIDGTQISSSADITKLVDGHKAGDKVTITVSRGNRQGQATLTLEEYKGTGLSL